MLQTQRFLGGYQRRGRLAAPLSRPPIRLRVSFSLRQLRLGPFASHIEPLEHHCMLFATRRFLGSTGSARSFTSIASVLARDNPGRVALLRQRFEQAAPQLGISDLSDWYEVTSDRLRKRDTTLRTYLLHRFDCDLSAALAVAFPDHHWERAKFVEPIHKRLRSPKKNQLEPVKWDQSTINSILLSYQKRGALSSPSSWYSVKLRHLAGQVSLSQYEKSLIRQVGSVQVLLTKSGLFPGHTWLPWKFADPLPQGFWTSSANRRWFLDHFRELMSLQPEQWYRIRPHHIRRQGGDGLLAHYQDCVASLVMTEYPEHKWFPWRFKTPPRDVWDNPAHLRIFFDTLFDHFGLKSLVTRRAATPRQIVTLGGSELLSKHGDIRALLDSVYPEWPET